MLSEHKHCDNAANNSNSENARSRMVASLPRRVGTGTKEDGFKYWARLRCSISPCYGSFSLSARFETYEEFISLIFQIFSGRGKPRIRRPACKFEDDCDMQPIVTRWLIAQSADRYRAEAEELVS
jgi:hypothetical protein